MTEAYLILRDFGNRVAEVHLSEVNAASKHEPISYGATLAYQQVASLIPETIPSSWNRSSVPSSSTTRSKPRTRPCDRRSLAAVRRRRSGAMARLVHT